MKRGFIFGGALVFAGLVLQLAAGPLDWSVLAWPVNIIVLCAILALLGVMYALRRKVPAFEWMMHYGAAVPAMAYAIALTVIMGLTTQVEEGGIPWLSRMLSFWPFILCWAWVVLISGLASLNHLMHFKVREIPFILNHLGVFVAVVCASLGNPDARNYTMTAYEERPETMVVDANGQTHESEFSIELHSFIMESYEDGTPKRFASDISVLTKDGRRVRDTVDVNKPMKVAGWNIYQYDYDEAQGEDSEYSVLALVRDPWLPFVYAGILMMIAGALCLMLFMAPKPARL